MLKTLPLFTVLTLSQIATGMDINQQCAEDVIALMQEDGHFLGYKGTQMMRSYNETCEEMKLCSHDFDEDMVSYLGKIMDEDGEAELPEVPIEGTAKADFGAFNGHESYIDFVNSCTERGGFVKFYNITLDMEGTAMDLVDVKVSGSVTRFPFCSVKGCEEIDPEETLLYAVKHSIVANAPEMPDRQKALINGMTFAMLCAASGIETCEYHVVATDNLIITSALSSGSVAVVRIWGMALMTSLGVWFAFF